MRSPASAIALENVRSTTRLGCCSSSGTTERPANSWYASSITTSPSASRHSRSISALGRVVPVGLFGEQTIVSGASAWRRASRSRSAS